MAGEAKQYFVGAQKLATVEDLEAFARRAAAGESFTYCEAPDLIHSPTSRRAGELAQQGLLRTHHKRRAAGGWEFYAVRTGKAQQVALTPADEALADPATDIIFRELKRAANLGLKCPTDADLARKAGFDTRDRATWRVRRLLRVNLIESTVAYENGVPMRVVTIVAGPLAGAAGGKRTALPPKWRALEEAIRRGQQPTSPANGAVASAPARPDGARRSPGSPAAPSYPRGRGGAL